MATKKPYEMTFAEFSEAIQPSWAISVADPLKRSSDDSEWLTSVWSSLDNRLTYWVFFRNTALKNEMPPESREYQFDDLSLHPVTEKLGLDPESQDDNSKAAQLLALRNAWVTAIQCHYGQSATDIPSCKLTNAATSEYVLLTSGLMHPWIQERIRLHIAEQNQKKLEQTGKVDIPVEISSDPNWPSTSVIYARTIEPSAQELTEREQKLKDIRYWLQKFKSEDGNWSSQFEVHAYEAQSDIDIANQKIVALQRIIEKQRDLIQSAERIVTKNKRHEAAMRASKKIGRPEKSKERQEMAIKFTSQWVQSLMDALNVEKCAQLEIMINGSNQRNWLRWLKSKAVPTHSNLSELLNAEITQGNYKGKPLLDVKTNPEHNDLLSLIHLT